MVVPRFFLNVICANEMSQLSALKSQTRDGVLGLLDMFSGGAFSNASIFALGIMPYISASIVMQLMQVAVPYFQKMQKEGESGRNRMNQITRVLTIAITMAQSIGYLATTVPAEAIVIDPFLFRIARIS